MSYQHKDLLSVHPENVSSSCLASLQQPIGILLLEESLIQDQAPHPPAKRARRDQPPDTLRWIHLARSVPRFPPNVPTPVPLSLKGHVPFCLFALLKCIPSFRYITWFIYKGFRNSYFLGVVVAQWVLLCPHLQACGFG